MALRFYLNQEAHAQAVEQLGRDTFFPDRDGVNINGITVKVDSDIRPYYEVRNERVPLPLLIPPAIKDMVQHCSWLMPLWPNCPIQEPGIYSHESAEATIERQDGGYKLMLHVYGPKIEDVYGLMRAIRAGRAEVVESWAWEIFPDAENGSDETRLSDEQAGALMDMLSSGAESEADSILAVYTANPDRPAVNCVVIQCHDCRSKWTIDGNRTMGKTVKVLCRECGANIHVADGKVVDNPERTDASAPEDPMVDAAHVVSWYPKIKLACPNCNAKYTMDPDKAKGRTIRLRCRKCGQHMELKGREPNSDPTGGNNGDVKN